MVALPSAKGVGNKAEPRKLYSSLHILTNMIIHFMQTDIPYTCCVVSAAEGVGLGHPIEYICLDLAAPNVCKYCGLRYVQVHHH